jgi:hypothetical protein
MKPPINHEHISDINMIVLVHHVLGNAAIRLRHE